MLATHFKVVHLFRPFFFWKTLVQTFGPSYIITTLTATWTYTRIFSSKASWNLKALPTRVWTDVVRSSFLSCNMNGNICTFTNKRQAQRLWHEFISTCIIFSNGNGNQSRLLLLLNLLANLRKLLHFLFGRNGNHCILQYFSVWLTVVDLK